MIIVLMGVTGVGKTTVGRLLANELGWEFHDADDLHPPVNVEKMRQGVPLTDADREPWLESVSALIRLLDRLGTNAVFACSALRDAYRRRLSKAGPEVKFVFLHAAPEMVATRLEQRPGHFMHPRLVPRQFEALEPPMDAIWIDAAQPPEMVVAEARKALGL